MVVASNEWLNNYEDEQKSAPANTTTAANENNITSQPSSTTSTTTTTTTATTNPITANSTTATTDIQTIPIPSATTTTTTTTADNANINDQTSASINQQHQNPMINTNSQIMDDTIKVEKDPNETENNNSDSSSSSTTSNNSNSNTIVLNASNSSSNITNSTNSNQNTNQVFSLTPITPQAFSSALQSALSNLHEKNGQAKIVLDCEPNSHPFKTRTILLTPNIECKVGRLIAKSKASDSNAIFDCKVLSRNHAVLFYSPDGKFWVKDTNSSNGTFINERKLGTTPAELHFGDVVKFGVDVMENSRKEVHGCIIAVVKLYLPDGRETISIEANNELSPYSGEGWISFDELHRLNLYMQEASQREKVLKSKLFNIQNVLDATRKNSALCWQSMIAEDQLLHRIHSLEKKLQLMEKNVPESVLRDEVNKLLEDKNSYQHSAKEALRKVYQERCDAMQMLSKMESAYTTSDNECKILRDQIMNTKKSLQDVNDRLLTLDSEYNMFKEETKRQQQEAKEQSEQRLTELTEKLNERELECEELRRKISELLLKRAEMHDDEEQLQKQAIEKLDAAIADMDLGDDDEDDDEDIEQEEEGGKKEEEQNNGRKSKADDIASPENDRRKTISNVSEEINGDSNVVDARNDNREKEKTNSTSQKTSDEAPQEDGKEKVGKKSTILKWLENSDLNKKEGSLDIFEAICNESDSSDEQETSPSSETGAGTKTNSISAINKKSSSKTDNKPEEDFETKCTKFNSKLRSVQKSLSQLEAEIANETNKTADVIASLDDGSAVMDEESDEDDDDEDDEEEEFTMKRNGKLSNEESNSVISKDNKSYILLKASVSMLREAYNEICDNIKQQQQEIKQQSPPPAISVQTQFQNYASHKLSNSAVKKLEAQQTLIPNAEQRSDSDDDDDEDDDDDVSEATTRLSLTSLQTIKEAEEIQHQDIESISKREKQIDSEIRDYQKQIEKLNMKLEQLESDSQNTLEIMQIECDAFKDKAGELAKLVDTLRDEKQALEQVITENKSNAQKTAECQKEELVISEQLLLLEKDELLIDEGRDRNLTNTNSSVSSGNESEPPKGSAEFEQQMRDELSGINDAAVQREEELITYKEQLEQMQNDNLKLRNEIAKMKLKADDYYTQTLLKRILPYGAVVIAILVYFIFTYF